MTFRHVRLGIVAALMVTCLPTGAMAQAAAARLQAGAATANITPPLGAPIVGGWAPFPATYIHDELHARALVLDDGTSRVAIVVVDSLGVPRYVLDHAKRVAAEHTGIAVDRILVSATHTHSASSALGERWSPADYDLAPTLDAYQSFLATRIADVIRGAAANLQPAQIAWGRGALPDEVFNRRWFMKPGPHLANPFGGTDRVQMNPAVGSPDLVEPAGPTDPEIAFVAVRRAGATAPLAVLANYSLHYVGGVPQGHVSADYYGAFARTLSRLVGADRADPGLVAMLSNGTSGDINNIDVRGGQERLPPYERMERVAARVAAVVYQGLQPLAWRDHVTLAATQRAVTLQRRSVTPEMQAWAREALARPVDAPRHPRERIYAERILGSAGAPPNLEVLLQAFRIGDLAITTFPFEVFAEIGLEIKKRSPFPQTFTTSLANGSEGYLPTKRQHAFGGYEAWLGTNRVELDAARIMTDALLEMLAGLSASQPARAAVR
ncbi:Neutral/alkaline non-lysosomal ceramidase [Luteitalea pratensis]|uniref:Neutral/alkaline non-lysosomal ceramidase n=1 Tax=Luteitalea pratensis TaxID=1855912 RepID=A0A143PTW2_LUTPR|nr:neutral/alkaline non-lysosomal ceramidase N-terminal domain-containing protein [Luteitalea pratensis]AMY11776.1 Neutral/alkaline non-lysosomal ceramidase [Luteitalea pratensis]